MRNISKEHNKLFARKNREKKKLALKETKIKIQEFTTKNDEITKEILKLKNYIFDIKMSALVYTMKECNTSINDIDIRNLNPNWEYN